MVDEPTPPADGDEQLERLLVELLDRFESGGADAVEPLLTANPAHAPALRRHLSRLRGLGLVQDEDQPARVDFPERLGDFRLLRRLGSGGMGVVYLAEQESLGRRVALKLVRPELLWFDGARERFRREVDSIARLQHPGIVPVFAAGEDQGVPWLAMEYVVGATLDEVLQQLAGRDPTALGGRDLQQAVRDVLRDKGVAVEHDGEVAFAGLGWPMACAHVVRDVGRAMQHAHRRGVLHRDVKPGNIVLTPDGRALLLDFGLAAARGAVRLTASHGVLGSPAYMSPEQLRGERDLDARSDVYALGLTLYELLTHHAPYAVDSIERARAMVLAGSAPPPRAHNRAVPRDLEVVCRKAIEVERRSRYASAQAFADDLDNALASRPIAAAPPGALQRVQRWTRRHPARAVAAAAAFLLLFVAPSVFLLQQRTANDEIRRALGVARRDRDRAREVVEVLLEQVANEDLLRVPRMQGLRRALLTSARDFHERFLADGGEDPDSAARTADSALQVALLDGELGLANEALQSAARAVELARALVGGGAGTADDRRLLARALTMSGEMHVLRGELQAGRADLEEAAAFLQRPQGGAPDARSAVALLNNDQALSMALRQLDEPIAADAVDARMDAVWRQLEEAPTTTTEQLYEGLERYFTALIERALASQGRGEVAATEATLDRSDALLRDHPDSATRLSAQHALDRLRGRLARAGAEHAAGAIETAERCYREVIDGVATLLEHNPEYAVALRTLANAQNDLMVMLAGDESRQADAIPLLEQAIDTLRRLAAAAPEVVENRVNLAASITNLGSIRLDQGDAAAAGQAFDEAGALIEAAIAEVPTRVAWHDHLYKVTWFAGQAQAASGDHVALRRTAARLAAQRSDDARTQRIAAGMLASAVAAAARDEALSAADRTSLDGELKADAMTLLRRAAMLGCTDHEWLRDGDEFAPLRGCDGYDEVLVQVAANRQRADR
ncbi:MAG: serine/threonine protein kinase [Planctomycetes bacterium]|nr:serine/threonine protein kinase [Planctomycetota bacterium]